MWGPTQSQLYRELCNAAFDLVEGDDFSQAIWDAVARFPVYPAEITEVLEHLADEIGVVHASGEQSQWSKVSVDAMQRACRDAAVKVWSAPRTMRPSSMRRPRLLRSSEATSTPLTGMKRSGE